MLKHRLRLAATGMVAALLLGGIGVSAQAAEKKPVIVPILTCPFGCGIIESNTIFGNLMAQGGERLIVSAQETPGYMYNVQEMAKEKHWKRTVFGTEDVIIQLAIQGGTPELKEFLPKKIPIKFKLLHGEAYWAQGKFFVTTDPSIKTIADMKGKRISLGLRGQSDWGVYPRLILEHAYGITPQNSDIRHMTPGALSQQLIDGTTDVCVTGFGTNTDRSFNLITGPLRKLEASGKKLYYIPIDQWAIDKVNKKFGTTFVTMTIKAGTMPGQSADALIGFVRGYKAVHPEFPQDVAYEFVLAAHKYAKKMHELHALFKMLTPDMMVDGLTEGNTHPGAIRAYKEIGIWDRRKKFTPVTYP